MPCNNYKPMHEGQDSWQQRLLTTCENNNTSSWCKYCDRLDYDAAQTNSSVSVRNAQRQDVVHISSYTEDCKAAKFQMHSFSKFKWFSIKIWSNLLAAKHHVTSRGNGRNKTKHLGSLGLALTVSSTSSDQFQDLSHEILNAYSHHFLLAHFEPWRTW